MCDQESRLDPRVGSANGAGVSYAGAKQASSDFQRLNEVSEGRPVRGGRRIQLHSLERELHEFQVHVSSQVERVQQLQRLRDLVAAHPDLAEMIDLAFQLRMHN